ncbi:MAG: hypothetical protein Kow0063_25110 [Anaerolineae bacterium]
MPDEIIEAMQQKRSIGISGEALMRYAARLKQDFPGTPDATVAQILGAIPKVDLRNLQPLIVEQGGKGVRKSNMKCQDGSRRANVIVTPQPLPEETTGQRVSVSQRDAQPRARDDEEHLSESDFAVLKRVPRRDPEQRLSA